MLRLSKRNRYLVLNRIELSRSAMLHNFRLIEAQHPGQLIIPVLKSNAYGHGLKEVAQILNDLPKGMLAVDGYFEAATIRRITHHRILVMGYIDPANVRLLDTKRCSFVVQDVAGLEAFAGLRRPVKIHLELNTGMQRLGLGETELDEYLAMLKKYPKLQLEGVMTHLADADNADDGFTAMQVEKFDRAVECIRNAGFNPPHIHIAQTAGSTKAKSRYANGIRLGIGLYGINPLTAKDANYKKLSDLRPVLSLKSTIIKINELKPGDKVSYNGIFTAKNSMKIAILPLGYYEGVPRALSNKGVVTAGKSELPIVGRVCMNHTMIDITSTNLKVGDELTVISNNPSKPNSIAQLATHHNLFSYNLLTSIASATRHVITD